MKRLMEAERTTVIRAYEDKIADLEESRIAAQEKLAAAGKPKHTFGEMFELAMTFLSNPWNIWESGDYHMRRIVLKLAFTGRIPYDRKSGFLNPGKSFPFRLLDGQRMDEFQMVPQAGLEPATYALRMRCSTN